MNSNLPTRHAILIGNTKFPNSNGSLHDLRSPLKDVLALQKVLKNNSYCNYKVVPARDKTSKDVAKSVSSVFNSASPGDLVLIYYSGHGKLDGDGNLYLATKDTEPEHLIATALSGHTLRTIIKQSNVRRTVLILDCCYSGAIDKEFTRSELENPLTEFKEGTGTFVMTASTSTQLAKETEEHGVFTKHLIEGLSGEADADEDGVITAQELYAYVHERVELEENQSPTICNHVSGELIVAVNPSPPIDGKRQKIRQHTSSLWVTGEISGDIMNFCSEVVELPSEQLRTGTSRAKFDELDRLANGDITTNQFINRWYAKYAGQDEKRLYLNNTRQLLMNQL